MVVFNTIKGLGLVVELAKKYTIIVGEKNAARMYDAAVRRYLNDPDAQSQQQQCRMEWQTEPMGPAACGVRL